MTKMGFMKRLLISIGATALVVSLLILITPKAAHALVAALVQVTNTTANPAITSDADEATRIPYQSKQTWTISMAGVTEVVTQTATVPAGYRLVITNVSFNAFAESGNPVPSATISSNFAPDSLFPSFTGVYTGPAQGHAIGNQNLIRYIGAGDSPNVSLIYDAAVNISGQFNIVTVTGYLENCSVTGCPAIVH
jgi:hypothetical protein